MTFIKKKLYLMLIGSCIAISTEAMQKKRVHFALNEEVTLEGELGPEYRERKKKKQKNSRPKLNQLHNYISIHAAAKAGDLVAIQKYIEDKVDLNAPDANGDTALHHAADYRNIEILKALCAAGGNPNLANKQGVTSYGIAKISTTNGKIGIAWETMRKAYHEYFLRAQDKIKNMLLIKETENQ